jgi:TctA family transporter
VSLDLQTVGVDLATVPIDEVLGFRRENLAKHRAYARALRTFVAQLALLPVSERVKALKDREEELQDMAADLKVVSRQAWKRPAYFALALTGAAYAVKTGDILAGLLSGSVAILAPPDKPEIHTGTYSYLFSAADRYEQ